MPSQLITANRAVALSAIALLSFLARLLLDWRFVPEMLEIVGQEPSGVAVAMALILVFFAGWIWALLAAVRGSGPGLVAVLGFSLFTFLAGLSTTVSFCPSPCPTIWPLMEIAIWANLLLGLIAAIATGLQLQARRGAT